MKIAPPIESAARWAPVPKIIHQIWIGPKDPPHGLSTWREAAAAYGYEYNLVTNDNCRQEFVNQDLIDLSYDTKQWHAAADILRVELLRRDGGIYCDADFELRCDPALLICPIGFTCGLEADVKLTNRRGAVFGAVGFMAAPPMHPIIDRMIRSLPDNFKAVEDLGACYMTGPYLLHLCAFGAYAVAHNEGLWSDWEHGPALLWQC